MKVFLTLLKNNLLLEFRIRETVLLLGSLIVMLVVIIAIGLNSAFIDPEAKQKLYPCLLWVLFLLAATVSIGRSLEYENELGAIDGLILTGIPIPLIYVAKTVSNFLILLVAQVLATFLLGIFMNVQIPNIFALCPILIVAIAGYAALSTLLSGIAVTAKLKQILLPIILLPLLFPLFLCAVELTYQVSINGGFEWGSPWMGMLIGIDFLYLILGFNLFEYIVQD